MTEAQDAPAGLGLARDRHLFGAGPKRILALDGGGVRGAISVAFLERIEKTIREEQQRTRPAAAEARRNKPAAPPPPNRRTSRMARRRLVWATGSICRRHVDRRGDRRRAGAWQEHRGDQGLLPEARTAHLLRSLWRVPGSQAKFDAGALREEIDKIVEDRRLDSPDLVTGLCVVTKRLDTGSPWILANNSKAPYWNTVAADPATGAKGFTGNAKYRLSNLVRASTAAPHFFDPEVLAIIEDEREEPLADVNAKLAGYPWMSLLASKLRLLLLGFKRDKGGRSSPKPMACSSMAA